MQISKDETIMLPGRPSQNEREALEPFIRHFNSVENTCYEAVTWFDEERTNEPKPNQKPEVLLKDANGYVMVIERKSITLPEECSRLAGNFDTLSEHLWSRLSKSFPPDLYVLTLCDNDIKLVVGHQRRAVADIIVESVLAKREAIVRGRIVGDTHPIRWRFEQAPEHIREDYPQSKNNIIMSRDGEEMSSELEQLRKHIMRSAAYLYEQARNKMYHYSGLKVLVLEFYGDGSDYLPDTEIVNILKCAEVPAGIDQMWLTLENTISERHTWRRFF